MRESGNSIFIPSLSGGGEKISIYVITTHSYLQWLLLSEIRSSVSGGRSLVVMGLAKE